MKQRDYSAVAIGSSIGGLHALDEILRGLPETFPLPILIVQHVEASSPRQVPEFLSEKCAILVKEAEDKERIEPGTAYIAPPNYHLLVEPEGHLSLSVDDKENHSRPSIDVLFESAAEVFTSGLIGIVLTGASEDGSRGLERIKALGGVAIVQHPDSAEGRIMPEAAIARVDVDHILPLKEIGNFLLKRLHRAKEVAS